MLKIYLARHGQDQDNANGILNGHRDMPLTELGIEQTKELVKKIKTAGITFAKIYSSPLQRVYESAEIISAALAVDKIEIMPELIERDFGIMTGKSVSLIEKMCAPDIIKTPTVTYFLHPENGESFPQLLDRARLVLDKIEKRHKNGNILLMTSGDIGKMIYAAHYNLDWEDVLSNFHFGNSDLLLLSDKKSSIDPHVFNIRQYNG